MKVVSETTDEDRAKLAAERDQAEARWRFGVALRQLAANLIRVTRGAGQGYSVGEQANTLLEVAVQYRDAFGHWPSDWEYREALQHEDDRDDEYGPRQQRQDAIDTIIRGSLQIAASRMLEQPLQVKAGERELDAGLRDYVEWQEARRNEWAARDAAARPKPSIISKPRKK